MLSRSEREGIYASGLFRNARFAYIIAQKSRNGAFGGRIAGSQGEKRRSLIQGAAYGNVQNEDFMRGSGNISLDCRMVGISSPHIFCDGWGLACRLGRVRTVPTGDLPPGARSRGAAPHPAAFEKGKTSRSEVYETFPIFSRHLRPAVFLLLLTFISSFAHSSAYLSLAIPGIWEYNCLSTTLPAKA